MNEKESKSDTNVKDGFPSRGYSYAQQIVNNLPYAAMVLLGGAVFVVGFANPVWGWICASAYVIYGVAGAFWIMIFMCPYCRRWNTMSCPCGYGLIAARFRQKRDSSFFRDKFKKHIPVIVPLWLIPILVGVPLAVRSFSWPMIVLLVVFALVAFIVLPLFSKSHGCANCPEKNSCPWMGRKG